MTERRFDDRVAVITGAGRGLGREYALLLASRGAKVVVNDLGGSMAGDGADAGPAETVVKEIRAAGGDAVASTDSVATFDGGKAIIQKAIDAYGRVDVLIHNAGNVRYGSLDSIDPADFHAVVDVHLIGAFNVVRNAFPHMLKAGYGRVVLTSSIGGLYSIPNGLPYAVSKSGMIGINNVIALEGAAHGIRSNIILPGAVTRMAEGLDTSLYPPMGADLVAPVVAWLAHESCSVSGELYTSMAGRVARAFIAESQGVYRPSWTIDDVAEQIERIRDTGRLPEKTWLLPPLPSGFGDHLARSFEMARSGAVNRN
ncbi:SDR family NAD(P)-dependent oxidoreductase [Hydrocarboniphaga sp.]|uniref:SDR family NAD(P)-dependent oxidoreductase n=1 Tax=Hydrocarboniphaga sp. TaxID=2033016 RepID=UPI003D101567